jgi:trans-2,3-dihydro-3-hydroxyanthranilate isomerase
VFTDARGLDDATMQALALEIGFSETTFVLPPEQGGTARMRIFNPRHEMPFAGHPTLGTAFVLGAPLQLGVIALETGVGIVPVTLERDESGRIVFGRMTQPVPRVEAVEAPEVVLAAVGAERSLLPIELYDNGARHIVVTLEAAELGGLRPDGETIATFGITGVNCVAGAGSSWRSRMFWEHGEDPATGSAAGPIACHLARHGLVGWGEEIVITQGVEMGRPSALHARAEGGEGLIDAVEVGGNAVVVARGEFRV